MALQQRLSLSPRLSQRLVLTPAMQQAIKLLPLTTLELADVINQRNLHLSAFDPSWPVVVRCVCFLFQELLSGPLLRIRRGFLRPPPR